MTVDYSKCTTSAIPEGTVNDLNHASELILDTVQNRLVNVYCQLESQEIWSTVQKSSFNSQMSPKVNPTMELQTTIVGTTALVLPSISNR